MTGPTKRHHVTGTDEDVTRRSPLIRSVFWHLSACCHHVWVHGSEAGWMTSPPGGGGHTSPYQCLQAGRHMKCSAHEAHNESYQLLKIKQSSECLWNNVQNVHTQKCTLWFSCFKHSKINLVLLSSSVRKTVILQCSQSDSSGKGNKEPTY